MGAAGRTAEGAGPRASSMGVGVKERRPRRPRRPRRGADPSALSPHPRRAHKPHNPRQLAIDRCIDASPSPPRALPVRPSARLICPPSKANESQAQRSETFKL